MALLMQLSGINIIILYSTKIFAKTDISWSGTQVPGLIGVVNFLMTFGGMGILAYFGRKTIMVCGSFAMSVVLVGLGICF